MVAVTRSPSVRPFPVKTRVTLVHVKTEYDIQVHTHTPLAAAADYSDEPASSLMIIGPNTELKLVL